MRHPSAAPIFALILEDWLITVTAQNHGTAAESLFEREGPDWSSSPHSVLTDAAGPIAIDDARAIVHAYYGIDADIHRLSGERDDNFRVDVGETKWMLKIAHSKEEPRVTDFQSAILIHLAGHSVSVPTLVHTRNGSPHLWLPDGPAAGRAIRMTTFSPGTALRNFESESPLCRRLGATIADLDVALSDFRHSGADVKLLWDIQQAHRTRELIDHQPDLAGAEVLRRGFDRFVDEVSTRLAERPRQVIHNDANPDNVLVVPSAPPMITFIDFGDAVVAPPIVDLAVAASYHIGAGIERGILGHAADVIEGYHSRLPLTVEDAELLYDLITIRVLTALTIASWRATQFPENKDYILRNAAGAWRRLEMLESAGRRTIEEEIKVRCQL